MTSKYDGYWADQLDLHEVLHSIDTAPDAGCVPDWPYPDRSTKL
jgi:hypothetical protein